MTRTLFARTLIAITAAALTVAADRVVRHRYGAGLLARAGRATTVLTVRHDT